MDSWSRRIWARLTGLLREENPEHMEHVFREADRQATGYGRLVAGASLLLVLVVIVVAVILVVGHYS